MYFASLAGICLTDWYSGLHEKMISALLPISRIVLYLFHSIIFKLLGPCRAAVHLSFDGIKQSLGKIMVKDESGNNNNATMENDTKVILSGGKCGDGAASLNGMGFKCYAKCMNILKILKELKIPFCV